MTAPVMETVEKLTARHVEETFRASTFAEHPFHDCPRKYYEAVALASQLQERALAAERERAAFKHDRDVTHEALLTKMDMVEATAYRTAANVCKQHPEASASYLYNAILALQSAGKYEDEIDRQSAAERELRRITP